MKNVLISFLLMPVGAGLFAQPVFAPDTLLVEHFNDDPAEAMLFFPSGSDLDWVNWDEDGMYTECGYNNTSNTPSNWFWDIDLGEGDMTDNYAFTSCSYGGEFSPVLKSMNWLITRPVFITNTDYKLSWRSLTLEGPAFVDGYLVLLSTAGNLPEDFTDTLFTAAETLPPLPPMASLDLSDFSFSDGYIHANGYTATDFFFIDSPAPDYSFYHGRMEPHVESLHAYAGQTVYIAFLHNSTDDNVLQIDDILISKTTISAGEPYENIGFQITPNPVQGMALLRWNAALQGQLFVRLVDMTGKEVLFYCVKNGADRVQLDLDALPAGVYSAFLQDEQGRRDYIKLLKQD